MTRTTPGHGPVSRPVRRCTSVSRFPALSQAPVRRTPRSDGLHMTHRRAGDAARVGEPDDRSHLRGGHGSKGVRGRRPGEGGASSRAWEPGGRAPRRRRPAGRDTGPRPAGRAPHPRHRNRRKSHARPAEMTFDSMHPAAGRRATSPSTEDHSETAGITLFGAMGMRGAGPIAMVCSRTFPESPEGAEPFSPGAAAVVGAGAAGAISAQAEPEKAEPHRGRCGGGGLPQCPGGVGRGRAPVGARRRAAAGRAGAFPGRLRGCWLHLTGAGSPPRSSSRPVRWCCTLERVAPAGRLRVFRMIPGLLLECRFLADGLPCAERVALHMGGFLRR